MSEFDSTVVTRETCAHGTSEEDRIRNDSPHLHSEVRHAKENKGGPEPRSRSQERACKSDRPNVRSDNGMRDRNQTFLSNSTPMSVIERNMSSVGEEICDKCRSLNLDVLITQVRNRDPFPKHFVPPWERNESDGWPRVRVGFRYRREQTACALCRALAASRITLETNSGTRGIEVPDNGDEIQVKPYHAVVFGRHFRGAKKRAVRLFLVPQQVLVDFKIFRDYTDRNGSLVLLGGSIHPELFDPQPISHSFDSDLVGSWLQYCAQHHRLLCHLEPVPVRGVQVIDCTTLQIKDYNENTPYVSLSYVWGKSGDSGGHVKTIKGQKTLSLPLPLVIRDSIEVTKALGYRYLWIDKFCIDQGAADLKHDQIQQMDAIYKNSQLTIISAAGQDESYGLPGVSVRGRRHQFLANINGATVLWDPLDPHRSIPQSYWSTRGWTFQEAVLSRRRLVFTEDQVYFQCHTMNCFESNYCVLDELHVKDKSTTLETMRAGLFGKSRQNSYGKLIRERESIKESFHRYLSNVEEYTSRNLSFDEDSLNAFQGIIKQFSQERHAFDHVWGLAYHSNSNRRLDIFVHSLTWMHREAVRARRRELFPSWTWAGWEGQIEYHFRSETMYNFENRLHELRFRATTNESFALEEVNGARNLTSLEITAAVVPSPPSVYIGPAPITRQKGGPWRISESFAQLSWSDSDQTNDQIAEMFKESSRWQFLFLGSLCGISFVMVLKSCENGRTWQRAGMFEVDGGPFFMKFSATGQISTFEIE